MTDANIVQVVWSLTLMIRSDCSDVDHTRAVPASVIERLRSAGVFRMLAPREIGGAETDPLAFFDVVEAAASADGSVGWVVMIGGCYATFGGLLSPEGAAEIFGDPSTISAGAFRPEGTAIEVDVVLPRHWPLVTWERFEPCELVHRRMRRHA